MSRFPEVLLISCLLAGAAHAGPFGLGREATPNEIAAWDIDVRPDGQGLPEGRGSVADGEVIFTERCAACHGDFGEGVDRWPVLAGGQGTLTEEDPNKTIGSYWPYLSTVWDYVHRAMPFGDAQSLTADETYALTAYLLYLNDIVDDDFELSRENFGEVVMPNAEGFTDDPRPDIPLLADGAPCMTGCKPEVVITAHATVLDVTPEEDANPGGARVVIEGAPEPAPEPATELASAEPAAAPDPALVAEGEKVFRRCASCHEVGTDAENKVGPVLTGVVGSAAGQVAGFAYSGALADAAAGGLVWDEANLAAFLAAPRTFLKGTKMAFAGLRDEADIAALIAFLSAQAE